MYQIIPLKPFEKRFKELTKNNFELKKRVIKTLFLLEENPSHSSLKSHKVSTPEFGTRWSSYVTGDIRIIWDYAKDRSLVILLLTLGSHSGRKKVYPDFMD